MRNGPLHLLCPALLCCLVLCYAVLCHLLTSALRMDHQQSRAHTLQPSPCASRTFFCIFSPSLPFPAVPRKGEKRSREPVIKTQKVVAYVQSTTS
jgi:hypothetical protein